jgi:hypothetical protein
MPKRVSHLWVSSFGVRSLGVSPLVILLSVPVFAETPLDSVVVQRASEVHSGVCRAIQGPEKFAKSLVAATCQVGRKLKSLNPKHLERSPSSNLEDLNVMIPFVANRDPYSTGSPGMGTLSWTYTGKLIANPESNLYTYQPSEKVGSINQKKNFRNLVSMKSRSPMMTVQTPGSIPTIDCPNS